MNYWKIWIDTGGTFTDCIAQNPAGESYYLKVLSNSSLRGSIVEIISPRKICIDQNWNAPDNFMEGCHLKLLNDPTTTPEIRSFDAGTSVITLAEPYTKNIATGDPFEIQFDEEAPVLACHLVTGTPRNEKLPPIQLRLATTKGTNALLEGKGAPTLLLITKGFGNFLRIGDQKRPDLFSFRIEKPEPLYDKVIEIPERLNADGNVLQDLDIYSLSESIKTFLKQENTSVAVSLMHSYKNDLHEQKLKQWLGDNGANFVSTSAEMSPLIKLLPRAQTTVVNAYLDPVLQEYLDSVKDALNDSTIFVMNSAAGLASSDEFKPKDSLLSGPAGGVIGAAAIGNAAGKEKIISLDMGGTSTDVARYDHGFDYQFEHTVGSATIKAPALAIETVAAGGGSICSFDGQKLTVGPESAGADPGPACYGAGGPLTLTDINLLLGCLQPENFNIPISQEAAESEFQKLLEKVKGKEKTPDRKKILLGLLQIANERMAEAIKKISFRKGYDPSEYALVAFGGAGAQHATAIASLLNIDSVLVPDKAGVLSAKGLGHASIEAFAERQILKPLEDLESQFSSIIKEIEEEARDKLNKNLGNTNSSTEIRRRIVFMRLEGQESTLEVEYQSFDSLHHDFREAYEKRYGHWVKGRRIEVESVRVIAAANSTTVAEDVIPASEDKPPIAYQTKVQFATSQKSTPAYRRSDLKAGQELHGPAIIIDPHSTTVIEPGWSGSINPNGTLHLTQQGNAQFVHSAELSESINLELFTNRFSSIAEEMGQMMQRTALSVNVKERMDFSCALLNTEGELIVNAPHIPVHLGALGLCVRRLKESIEMKPGDAVATNHPHFGGSHLPDITVVTPVYDNNQHLGYAACRAHHSEIGGTRPGSMPPNASSLAEEGVVIPPTHLIKGGDPQWNQIRTILSEAPYPSRAVEENIADLQAAVAANHQGVQAMRTLADKEGSDKVRHYMTALKTEATEKAKKMIRSLPDLSQTSEEFLDDGTPLRASIEKQEDQLTIDFSGTGGVHPGNLNATLLSCKAW